MSSYAAGAKYVLSGAAVQDYNRLKRKYEQFSESYKPVLHDLRTFRKSALRPTSRSMSGRVVGYGAGANIVRTRTRGTQYNEIKKSGEFPTSIVPIKNYMLANDNNKVLQHTRVLYHLDLIFVPKQSTDDEINLRDGNKITVLGHSFNIRWENVLPHPIFVNHAIVIPRGTTHVTQIEFFREWGTSRYEDFDVKLCSENFNRPINKDKYHIIRHKRYILGGLSNNQYNLPNTPSTKTIRFWLPIKRTFTFRDEGGFPVESFPILVTWFDQVPAVASWLPHQNAVNQWQQVKMVYTEN